MAINLLDSENADRDLTSQVTVLTDTPSTSVDILCQGLVFFGDGVKDLDGSGGPFEMTITIGGQTVEPDPQVVWFSTAVRSAVFTKIIPVPTNDEVIIKTKSPSTGDVDVDITAYLFNLS